MERVCAVCGSKSGQRCSSCSSVWYCSAEHQKEHWKTHKGNCPFFKIAKDSKFGKGYVATRDIREGTHILQEEPVTFVHSSESDETCLSCGSVVGGHKCSKCKLRVCSLECERLPIHAENECQLFSSRTIPYPNPILNIVVLGIRVALLKRKNPSVYQEVLQLYSSNFPLDSESAKLLEDDLHMLLAGVNGVEINSEEIGKLLRILNTNCTGMCTVFGLHAQKSTIAGLFLQSSRMNHSCIPNCYLIVQGCLKPQLKIRTARAVKKGEALTYFQDYSPPWSFYEGTKRRQEMILWGGNIRCECARCKDPTELGTYMSGVVCKTCKGNKTSTLGYLLPEDPLDLSHDAKWKCNGCECIQLSKDILPEVEQLAERLSNIETQIRPNHCEERLIQSCKRLVDETSGVTLHPNHWVIQKAMLLLGSMSRACSSTMTGDSRDYLIKCWKHLLCIHDLLNPGLLIDRAQVHTELADVLAVASVELFSKQKYEEALKGFEEAEVHYKEALKFYERGDSVSENSYGEYIKIKLSLIFNMLHTSRFKLLMVSG